MPESKSIWEGERVRLRAVEPEDAEVHWRWDTLTDDLRAADRLYFPRSHAGTRAWAESAGTFDDPNGPAVMQIESLVGELVGQISTHRCDPRVGTFSYGLAIRPEHRRKGYASEAIHLVLRFYFDELRYQKVTTEVYDWNEPSLRLHERLGFTQEGRLRRMGYSRGRHFDIIVFGMTAEEFAAQGK